MSCFYAVSYRSQAETINRLLKKQTRPRGGRKGGQSTPRVDNASRVDSAEEDADLDEASAPPPEPEIPTMLRWISSSKPPPPPDNSMDIEGRTVVSVAPSMSFAFAIPPNLVYDPPPPPPPRAKAVCSVVNCNEVRKYRLVRDFERGACGLPHLKVLEAM